MKRHFLHIIFIILGIFMIFESVNYGNHSIKDDYTKGVEISPELLKIELEYTLLRFPSPVEPMSYKIQIDEKGTLTKEYISAEMYGNDFDAITKQLSESELVELIDVIITNGFFKLPENIDGINITCQDSKHLTITYNGKTHKCSGYNTKNEKYLLICDYIEKLLD